MVMYNGLIPTGVPQGQVDGDNQKRVDEDDRNSAINATFPTTVQNTPETFNFMNQGAASYQSDISVQTTSDYNNLLLSLNNMDTYDVNNLLLESQMEVHGGISLPHQTLSTQLNTWPLPIAQQSRQLQQQQMQQQYRYQQQQYQQQQHLQQQYQYQQQQMQQPHIQQQPQVHQHQYQYQQQQLQQQYQYQQQQMQQSHIQQQPQ
ncbi:hypothetical protein EDD21DRAFT_419104, partial [Dissophora ornata]